MSACRTNGTGFAGPTGWFDPGVQVNIGASPRTSFNRWEGAGNDSYTGHNNPASVIMNGPITKAALCQQFPP